MEDRALETMSDAADLKIAEAAEVAEQISDVDTARAAVDRMLPGLPDNERKSAIERLMVAVRETADKDARIQQMLEVLTNKRDQVARDFAEIIKAAKDGDPGAMNKLRNLDRTSDPGLGMRLALMNRSQRLAFTSSVKHSAAQKKLAKLRKDKKARDKAKRRGKR